MLTLKSRWAFVSLILLYMLAVNMAFRILEANNKPNGSYFQPFDKGFVGISGQASNYQRERINEGAFETATQELLFEGPSPRQACPGMVGPFSDGNYYCTAREYGYCDRRSGTCFCNIGYQGIDCSECQGTHFLIGSLCFPKKLCPNDCSGAGACNFYDGVCACLPHRVGLSCETKLCTIHSPLCETCTDYECLSCLGGYYLTGNASKACSSCYDFDPRCSGCTKEQKCTVCADPLLTSVRRSGYRASDPALPLEENSRELGITLPFGTKSAESFAEAEYYFVGAAANGGLLKDSSIQCEQGLKNDETWVCEPFPATHKVCGHYGVFSFEYPNYAVLETSKAIKLTVSRSGGGYGAVNVNYFIKHFTTNDSDVTATAPYTTSQKLTFSPGMVRISFLVTILDDSIVEENEVFQVVLETPEGGGSVGTQFRTNVTIIDDDWNLFSAKLSKLAENSTFALAGQPFSFNINAVIARDGAPMTTGGEKFLAVIENNALEWANPNTPTNSQRQSIRHQANVTDNGDGTYTVWSQQGIVEQGSFQLRTWHAFPNGLMGEYYQDAFFQNQALHRIDPAVNFTWGTGRLLPRGSDYITIRWSGVILPPASGYYYFKVEADDHARLWIDGQLLLDHWHEREVNMEPSRMFPLIKDKFAEILLEYREVNQEAHIRLLWGLNPAQLRVITPNYLYSLYEVDRSPLIVQISSGPTVAATSECSGDGLFAGEALKVSYFSVCPRDQYGNMRDDDDYTYLVTQLFSASLYLTDDMGYEGVGAEIITARLAFNNATSCFDGSYAPERAGLYRLEVTFESGQFATSVQVAGSPFIVSISPTKTSGPYSRIFGLENPLYLEAGACHNFTIVARDTSRNLKLMGGDNYQVYTYQVDYYSDMQGVEQVSRHTTMPTGQPTGSPTTAPTSFAKTDNLKARSSPALETLEAVVRYGTVYDRHNGNYTVQICPVIAGWHEVHVLLNAHGISNQPFQILDKTTSLTVSLGQGSFSGQYVHDSPYTLIVSHTVASAFTSTAVGSGLVSATVGIPNNFMVTVRDPWDNVLRTATQPVSLVVVLNRSPHVAASIWSYQNGSYNVQYVANVSGLNLISVFVNNLQIVGSPYTVPFTDGQTSASYSYVEGPGLVIGTAGVTSYFQVYSFDIDNNRKTDSNSIFAFTVHGSNNITGYLLPCPFPPISSHPICNLYDLEQGHYFGSFVPAYTGLIVISVYLENSVSGVIGAAGSSQQLSNSPFFAEIFPTSPHAEGSDVVGVLYDNVAGVQATVNLQLRDTFGNKLVQGGAALELTLLGVGVEWGTIQPWGTTPGLPDAYHYRGFYAGFPTVYGDWVDYGDGSYSVSYTAPAAGLYVLRLALAEAGLNVTYFNDTTFGYLVNQDFNMPGFSETAMGQAVNLGSSVSWTGDWGRRPGTHGDLGQGTYYNRYKTVMESSINYSLANTYDAAPFANFNVTMDNQPKHPLWTNMSTSSFKYREEYWSARWLGMITPQYAEEYIFSVSVDGSSSVRLFIGGVGNMMNCSAGAGAGAQLVVAINDSSVVPTGSYLFTDTLSREIVLEYIHKEGEAHMSLLWQSATTPLSVVPPSAFSHWRNISHYNTTIHPAALCAHCSTAYGEALASAQVNVMKSFVVYGRDSFGNLLQTGGDTPSMVAVGPNGVAFRGTLTDYGNSTYLINYLATNSGQFRMYVTIGCCPPHPNVGISSEIDQFSSMLVAGAPFLLTVTPAPVVIGRSVAGGSGLLGAQAGQQSCFTVTFRDIYNNPTQVQDASFIGTKVSFTDVITGNAITPSALSVTVLPDQLYICHNITRASTYSMQVNVSVTGSSDGSDCALSPIVGSPFNVIINPVAAVAALAVCRGVGLRQASVNRQASFEVQLYDVYNNNVIVGGNKLFVRLIGDANFASALPAVPLCVDTRNGRLQCTYTTLYSGPHQLVIKLLNMSSSHPGGTGLTGYYYTSSDGIYNAQLEPAEAVQVSPSIALSWPTGHIIPNSAGTGSTGQAVRWRGYIVAPSTDSFAFTAWLTNIACSVRIDSRLVFDSSAAASAGAAAAGTMNNIINTNSNSTRVSLLVGSAYAIEVVASVSAVGYAPVAISLAWSTPGTRWSVVPQFFLYNSAQDIRLSPFPVTVS